MEDRNGYALVYFDANGNVTRWNATATLILGWAEEEMLGRSIETYFTPQDLETHPMRQQMQAAREYGQGIGARWYLRKDGRRFWAPGLMLPELDPQGQVTGFIHVLRDRTAEHRREQRFVLLSKVSAGLLDATDPDQVLGPILEQSTDLLGFDESYSYVLTPDCEHLQLTHSVGASAEVRATLQHASFDLPVCGEVVKSLKPLVIEHMQATTEPRYEVGRRCGYDAFAAYPVMEGQTLYGIISFAARGRTSFDEECLAFFATLANHVALVRARLAREAALLELTQTLEQRVEQRTGELHDAEAALRQAQKMEAVGQLTGGLAHDFNNLLVGITGSLELLQERLAQGRLAGAERYISAAQGAATRAAALTHRLLAFSRRQTLEPRPVRLGELVQGMEELIRRTLGPHIALACSAESGLWVTQVDPGQLENSLLNLCINARDAMPDGGRLVIDCRNRALQAPQAKALGLEAGEYLCLSVQDSGTGMAPQVLAKAFDPFFTTKPLGQGTGLGLSMIYGFAHQSHGQVQIRSQLEEGTEVCLFLPRFHGAHAAAEVELGEALEPAAPGGQTVLVVDDEPTVRMLVTEVLGEAGYRVVEAGDGATGLEVLNSDLPIDLLVTDVGLPGGMNGRQLADAARVSRPQLQVLFITGYAETAVLSHGHLDPGMHVMTKPFGMQALASRIVALIGQG